MIGFFDSSVVGDVFSDVVHSVNLHVNLKKIENGNFVGFSYFFKLIFDDNSSFSRMAFQNNFSETAKLRMGIGWDFFSCQKLLRLNFIPLLLTNFQ